MVYRQEEMRSNGPAKFVRQPPVGNVSARTQSQKSVAKGCSSNMRRLGRRAERLIYRFLISLTVGFFVGLYTITNSDDLATKDVAARCFSHRENRSQSTHTNNLLHISLLSRRTNHDRVKAILDTWANDKKIDNRIDIFVKDNDGINTHSSLFANERVRIINLQKLSTATASELKQDFMTLKFVHDNYLKQFNWFAWLRDDTYVRIDKLEQLLRSVDPRKPYFIGKPSRYTILSDSARAGYCMGQTGVIISRALLQTVGPYLANCLQDSYSYQSDLEFGRCVAKWSGSECTEAWDTEKMFLLDNKRSYPDGETRTNRRNGITFHTREDPRNMYSIHINVLRDKIADLVTRVTKLDNEIQQTIAWRTGKVFDIQGWNLHGEAIWDFIDWENYSLGSDVSLGTRYDMKQSTTYDVLSTLAELQTKFSVLGPAKIDKITVMESRIIVNPTTSIDFVAKIRVEATVDAKPVAIRLKNLYYRKTFAYSYAFFAEDIKIFEQNLKKIFEDRKTRKLSTGNEERVNFIVPLSGRSETFIRFLMNFEDSFLKRGENVSLTIVYFGVDDSNSEVVDMDKDLFEEDERTKFGRKNLKDIKIRYPQFENSFIRVRNGLPFSRGVGLQMGAERIQHRNSQSELLFFCDVDLVLRPEILTHIRRNTIQGKQVYYPTFFSQYDPDIVHHRREIPTTPFLLRNNIGFWRTFSYGMVAIHKSDFEKTGGFDLSIRGWGLEDQKFCDAVLKKAGLRIFRSNDPTLVHVFHKKDCPRDLRRSQRHQCVKSRAQHFASQTHLYRLWRERTKQDSYEMFYDPEVVIN